MLRIFMWQEDEMVRNHVWSVFLGKSSPAGALLCCVLLFGSLPEHCELSMAIGPDEGWECGSGVECFPTARQCEDTVGLF